MNKIITFFFVFFFSNKERCPPGINFVFLFFSMKSDLKKKIKNIIKKIQFVFVLFFVIGLIHWVSLMSLLDPMQFLFHGESFTLVEFIYLFCFCLIDFKISIHIIVHVFQCLFIHNGIFQFGLIWNYCKNENKNKIDANWFQRTSRIYSCTMRISEVSIVFVWYREINILYIYI